MAAGEYEIGPGAGRLLVRTYREGAAARAGHDLVIEAVDWRGRLSVPADPADADAPPAVSVRVNLGALRVREGTGGVKPLSAGDMRQIHQTMRKVLRADRDPEAVFTSRGVDVDGDTAVVEGDLALAGRTHPLRLQVRLRDDGGIEGNATVVQSRWGIKPYSGFFGALKVCDAVDVEWAVSLPPPEG